MVPGYRVNVQVPVAGRSDRTTLPVDKIQVVWVILLITGADTKLTDEHDTEKFPPVVIQPDEFLTEML